MRFDSESNVIHGHNRVGKRTKTYRTWDSMIQRCTNPNTKKYDAYGGSGITVCNRWREFSNFLEDMGEKPEGMTLDRMDPDKGYYKENCRWATYSQQSQHLSISKLNTSGTKGVCKTSDGKKWRAYIKIDYKQVNLGSFDRKEDAVAACKAAEEFYWGDDANGGLAC